MAELVIFLAAQQNARKNIIQFAAIGFRQTNDHFCEEVWVQVVIDMFLPVFRWVEQLSAAAFFKLQVEQNNIGGIEIIDGQLEENVVSLLKRFVFSKTII